MAAIQPTLCSALTRSARSAVLEVREATFKSRWPQDGNPSCSDDGPEGRASARDRPRRWTTGLGSQVLAVY